jgi:hypothetical protein
MQNAELEREEPTGVVLIEEDVAKAETVNNREEV